MQRQARRVEIIRRIKEHKHFHDVAMCLPDPYDQTIPTRRWKFEMRMLMNIFNDYERTSAVELKWVYGLLYDTNRPPQHRKWIILTFWEAGDIRS